MSVAASSSVSMVATRQASQHNPGPINNGSGGSSMTTASSFHHLTAAIGSTNSTSNSLADEARTKRLARLRTVIEVKLLAWKRANERLVFFQEGIYIPIKFKKRKEDEEGRNFILVVTANDKNRRVYLLILMETTHVNGVVDYRLVKPVRRLQRLRVINGGHVHQKISDIIGDDSDESDDSDEGGDSNDGSSTVVTRASVRSRIKEADKQKKQKKHKKYIVPEDLSWARRFPHEFTLVFRKNDQSLHFAVESFQQRSDCLCHLLEVFKEFYGYGFLPTLRNCTDHAVHSAYLNAATTTANSVDRANNITGITSGLNLVPLTTSADELITNTVSTDPSSGSDLQALDRRQTATSHLESNGDDEKCNDAKGSPEAHSKPTTTTSTEDDDEETDETGDSDSSEDETENDAFANSGDEDDEATSEVNPSRNKSRPLNRKMIAQIVSAVARKMRRREHQLHGKMSPRRSTTPDYLVATTTLSENSSRLMMVIVVEAMAILVLAFIVVVTQFVILLK